MMNKKKAPKNKSRPTVMKGPGDWSCSTGGSWVDDKGTVFMMMLTETYPDPECQT